MLRRLITTRLAHTRRYSTPRMEARIRAQLTAALQPVHCALVNESDKHAGPRGRETHFKVGAVAMGNYLQGISVAQYLINCCRIFCSRWN